MTRQATGADNKKGESKRREDTEAVTPYIQDLLCEPCGQFLTIRTGPIRGAE
jgi:hypothetical protein